MKSFPTLPQHPAAAYAIPQRHSQYDNEHSSVGTESFRVLPTGDRGSRRITSKFLRRYWFIVAISLFATLAVIGAIAALMAKAKGNQKQWYITADQVTQTTLSLSEYWIISGDSIIVSRKDLVNPICDIDSACRRTLTRLWLDRHRHPHLYRHPHLQCRRRGRLLLLNIPPFSTVERPLRFTFPSLELPQCLINPPCLSHCSPTFACHTLHSLPMLLAILYRMKHPTL